MSTITIPTTLIKETPNNSELGEKIRKRYNETIKEGHSIFPDNLELYKFPFPISTLAVPCHPGIA